MHTGTAHTRGPSEPLFTLCKGRQQHAKGDAGQRCQATQHLNGKGNTPKRTPRQFYTHKPFIEIRPAAAAAAAAAAARELNNTTTPHKHMKIVSRRLLFSSTSRAHELAFNELALEASSSNHSSVKHTSSK
jgi:hypothetical protein